MATALCHRPACVTRTCQHSHDASNGRCLPHGLLSTPTPWPTPTPTPTLSQTPTPWPATRDGIGWSGHRLEHPRPGALKLTQTNCGIPHRLTNAIAVENVEDWDAIDTPWNSDCRHVRGHRSPKFSSYCAERMTWNSTPPGVELPMRHGSQAKTASIFHI